jgi:hypothetical protein
VASTASLDTDLDDLARVLEREEQLLAVTEAAPGAAAADALRRLRREELHRALIVAEVSAALMLRPGSGWHHLLAALPEHRAETLRAHGERLRASSALPPSLRDFLDS